MRKSLLVLIVLYATVVAQAQYRIPASAPTRSLSQVWCPDDGDGTYTNPVLYADYSVMVK